MNAERHWEKVYQGKNATDVSWYQEHADLSRALIRGTGVSKSARIVDVGGGASTLVDDLLADGYTNLSVLDLSRSALDQTKARLGVAATEVSWHEADITTVGLNVHAYDVWHDRAVFHFLTEEADRRAYVAQVIKALKPGGHIIVATFGEDGPLQCSGLPIVRYSPDALHDEFGAAFDLIRHDRETHHTPWGSTQEFIYCYCRIQPS